MAYDDRLRLGRYVSPSGISFEFQFDALKRSGSKKHSVDEIPESNLAIVQDLGNEATQFPMSVYFSGPDYDLTADKFYAAINESGPGMLMHPRWGDIRVLPVDFSQDENMVNGLGVASFEIQFVYAADTPYLTSAAQTGSGIAATATLSQEQAAADFAAKWGVPSLKDTQGAKTVTLTAMNALRLNMGKLTGQIATLSQQVNAEISSIIRDIDTLILFPLELGTAIQRAISTASGSAELNITAKVNAYAAFASQLAKITPQSISDALIQSIMGHAVATALANSSTAGSLSSRSEAVQARDTLAMSSAQILAMVEAAERATGYSMSPEDVAAMVLLDSQAAAFLLETSFSLRAERWIYTEAECTPLDLIYRFYGSIDSLEEFCTQNHFNGNTGCVVPIGTKVRYYVG